MMTTELLTDADVAEILKVPSGRVVRLANRNAIPHIRLPGGEIRFLAADISKWIEAHRQDIRDAPRT